LPVVSPAPVMAAVMKTSRFISSGMIPPLVRFAHYEPEAIAMLFTFGAILYIIGDDRRLCECTPEMPNSISTSSYCPKPTSS
jgi:hypothetical protein